MNLLRNIYNSFEAPKSIVQFEDVRIDMFPKDRLLEHNLVRYQTCLVQAEVLMEQDTSKKIEMS